MAHVALLVLSIFTPDYAPKGEKKPLIIFLHGIGEKGTGSEKDLQKINCCGIPRYIDEGHNYAIHMERQN